MRHRGAASIYGVLSGASAFCLASPLASVLSCRGGRPRSRDACATGRWPAVVGLTGQRRSAHEANPITPWVGGC
jgi:hypothetical protein